jgi:hypothetical protein
VEIAQNKLTSNLGTRRELTKEFDSLLAAIRCLDGFERFLLGPSEFEFKTLAGNGPIVILNVSDFRSDAFLITSQNIRSLRLHALTQADLEIHAKCFKSAINMAGLSNYSTRRREMSKVLEWLWDVAVGPVLDELGFMQTPSEGLVWPRVWWVACGVLSILPIHAAGYHDSNPPRSAIDRVISSYTPTVKALAYARERGTRVGDLKPQKALLVGMPKTPEWSDLPFVEKELEEVGTILAPYVRTTVISDPTRETVLLTLPDHQILHLACHGHSSATDPSQSKLLLNDWRTSPLNVADLIELNIQQPEFAYLSACHTGITQDVDLVDESIHLSSAMQLAGFPSVIGSLWNINDKQAQVIAKDIYEFMRDGDELDTRRSAKALHRAVSNLRDELRKVPGFSRKAPDDPLVWAPYIHFGV